MSIELCISEEKLERFCTVVVFGNRVVRPASVSVAEIGEQELLLSVTYSEEVYLPLTKRFRELEREHKLYVKIDPDIRPPQQTDPVRAPGGIWGADLGSWRHLGRGFGASATRWLPCGGPWTFRYAVLLSVVDAKREKINDANPPSVDPSGSGWEQNRILEEARLLLLRRRLDPRRSLDENPGTDLQSKSFRQQLVALQAGPASEARQRTPASDTVPESARSVLHLANLIEYGTGTRVIWQQTSAPIRSVGRFQLAEEIIVGDPVILCCVRGCVGGFLCGCCGLQECWVAKSFDPDVDELSGGIPDCETLGSGTGCFAVKTCASHVCVFCVSVGKHAWFGLPHACLPGAIAACFGGFYCGVLGFLRQLMQEEATDAGRGAPQAEYGCAAFLQELGDTVRDQSGHRPTAAERAYLGV